MDESETLVRRGALGVLAAAGTVAVLVGVAFSGVATAVAIGDPGPLVRWGLPVVETLTELAASLTVGALLLAVCVLPRRTATPAATPAAPAATPATGPGAAVGRTAVDGSAYPRSLVLAGVAAGAWTVLSVVHLVLAYAAVAGASPTAPSFGDELVLFVTQIDLGRTLLSVTTVAAVVTALALVVATPTGAAWTAALALVALWQLGQTGHAAGAASHELATSAMVLHLVSAAVWIGALAALAVLVRRLGTDVVPAVARFSVVAGWCVVGVAVSGVVNSVLRLGGWDGLQTRYGVLLIVKVLLFGALALLGLAHRRATIPHLAGPRGGVLFWRVVLVELAVMGAVSGVAVALGSSPPPVPETAAADTSPAYVLTGHPLPPEPTALRWLTEWRWDVLMACAAAAGVVVYLRWVRRLRRRGDTWSWLRTASWVVGVLLFAWTTSGGPSVYGHVLFSAHMIQHMVLVMVVPLFVALSAPVTLLLRAVPPRATTLRGDVSRGPREWVLTLVHSRVGRFFANPLVAALNFAGSMVVFYYSGLFEWSLRSPVGHLAMVVHFTLAGYLFVNALAGIDPGPTRPAYPMRLLLLFATMAFHAFFGVALVGGEGLLVADWFGLTGRPWGPSAIRDQQLGGSIAWGIGEIPTLALAIVVAVQWTHDDERTARRRDRRVDRDGDDEMDEYNAMLAGLAGRDAPRPGGTT
ncbi:cytochrome c oxidase assembly protein [Cellulomonas dongxiuzhuiae]|uniref:Bifunctional copper resistance protein CopD/cytochrome c oxidase assembly protein n=1 Tax=Cellulomonas dongxiuzhuiae TaxID=2819979 RepID=A0ABX8GI54_9CELL|nr:cytochrome c oxidase assembly protein [Cellulomonas dongxiuzhuiae]MBO3094851.1 bifunctional copper resistance protein CopD/cytochrome c oxidase assembly protein [Cellulomonas dongxiuzhuiae]QWC15884.1 bifunctional copper resistance protein CopD/cytochrome c oxidase assembly protein [Cellulomonas dongxiuzhuiae]